MIATDKGGTHCFSAIISPSNPRHIQESLVPDQASAAFISYCRDDQEFVLRLAQDLKAAGAAVWLDQLDIKPGSSWDNAVEDALLSAPQMLVVLTPTSVKSENVRDEISYALKQGKTVIPVLYMECVIPLRLERKHHIDFRANYASGLATLLRQLHVEHPNEAVLDKAAEGDAQRQLAWQAREAEAERLRQINERPREEVEHKASHDQEVRVTEESRLQSEPLPPPVQPRRRKLVIAALLTLGVIVVGAVLIFARNSYILAGEQQDCDKGYSLQCDLAGEGSRDAVKAAAYYQKACDLNDEIGCHHLALDYEYGQGVPLDLSKARQILEKDCSLGYQSSCDELHTPRFQTGEPTLSR